MAIFGIGSHFGGNRDVAPQFIADGLVGSNWDVSEAPDIHQIIKSLKVGEIIYIKSFVPNSESLFIGAIGFIKDLEILNVKTTQYIEIGRNVFWKVKKGFSIPKPSGKNNVRLNTIYEEFHPDVQAVILDKLL